MSHHHLSGLAAWLVQRLSAIYMVLFLLIMGGVLVVGPEIDYVRWRGLFSQSLPAISTTVFFLALLLHMWVGVRDVILDYAGQQPILRLGLLMLLGGWLIAMGIWVVRIMFGVMVS